MALSHHLTMKNIEKAKIKIPCPRNPHDNFFFASQEGIEIISSEDAWNAWLTIDVNHAKMLGNRRSRKGNLFKVGDQGALLVSSTASRLTESYFTNFVRLQEQKTPQFNHFHIYSCFFIL